MEVFQDEFKEPDSSHVNLEAPLIIHKRTRKICYDKCLVIFIHGLGGKRYGKNNTWLNLPRFVYEDISNSDVGMYSYTTLFKRFLFWKSLKLEEEATILCNSLIEQHSYKRFVLIGHSMGGLLCMAAICALIDKNRRDVAEKIGSVLLCAVPQLGSKWAAGFLGIISNDIKALRIHSQVCNKIHSTIANNISVKKEIPNGEALYIPIWSMVAGKDLLVDPLSATIGIPASQTQNVRGSHRSIVKIYNKADNGYNFITEVINFGRNKPVPTRNIIRQPAKKEELPIILNLAKKHIGGNISDIGTMRSWHDKNQEIFWLLIKIIRSPQEIHSSTVGYYCVIPLNDNAVKKLKDGSISGSNIPVEDIESDKGNIAGLYIGGIVAEGDARPAAISYLNEHLNSYKKYKNTINVLAKPVTDKGLQLVTNHVMTKINQNKSDMDSLYEIVI